MAAVANSRVTYYYDPEIGNFYYAQGHPMKPHRVRMTHELVVAYGMFNKMELLCPPRASEREMTRFHADEYINFLKAITPETAQENVTTLQRFNVVEDCPVFDGLWDYCQIGAGGSLAAAARLNSGNADIAINWAGGLHHAKKAEASGFCYINDCVLAILELLKVHARVLYVDIDIHHGDGVEEAFYTTDRVMTVSFHKFGDYFPGTGDVGDYGYGQGLHYSVNFPLKDGIDDVSYREIFMPIMTRVMEWYRPGAVVLQCGADSLSGDRLGSFNLSLRGHAQCVDFFRAYDVPLLLLGGGGYTIRNVARCWAFETSRALGLDLSDNMPYNKYFEFYGPEFRLQLTPSNMENLNSRQYLENVKARVFESLRHLPAAPSVQMKRAPNAMDVTQWDQRNSVHVRTRPPSKSLYFESDEEEEEGDYSQDMMKRARPANVQGDPGLQYTTSAENKATAVEANGDVTMTDAASATASYAPQTANAATESPPPKGLPRSAGANDKLDEAPPVELPPSTTSLTSGPQGELVLEAEEKIEDSADGSANPALNGSRGVRAMDESTSNFTTTQSTAHDATTPIGAQLASEPTMTAISTATGETALPTLVPAAEVPVAEKRAPDTEEPVLQLPEAVREEQTETPRPAPAEPTESSTVVRSSDDFAPYSTSATEHRSTSAEKVADSAERKTSPANMPTKADSNSPTEPQVAQAEAEFDGSDRMDVEPDATNASIEENVQLQKGEDVATVASTRHDPPIAAANPSGDSVQIDSTNAEAPPQSEVPQQTMEVDTKTDEQASARSPPSSPQGKNAQGTDATGAEEAGAPSTPMAQEETPQAASIAPTSEDVDRSQADGSKVAAAGDESRAESEGTIEEGQVKEEVKAKVGGDAPDSVKDETTTTPDLSNENRSSQEELDGAEDKSR